MYLITGAAGKSGGVSRWVVEMLLGKGEQVRAMVHREDARAQGLRELGADVVIGDLTNPGSVFDAMTGVERMFFNMSVSLDYLEATAIVCAAAREVGGFDVIVNMSQMTVSQMTLDQHRGVVPAVAALAVRTGDELVGGAGGARETDRLSRQPAVHDARAAIGARTRNPAAAVRHRAYVADRGRRRRSGGHRGAARSVRSSRPNL